MNFLNGILNGFVEIWAHKLRSTLTIFSVMLGVAAMVVVMGMLLGIIAQSNDNIEEWGGMERISLRPGELPDYQESLQTRQRGLRQDDADALSDLLPDGAWAGTWSENQLDVTRGRRSFSANVFGVTPGYFEHEPYEIARGRLITGQDESDQSRAAIIGTSIANECFPRGEDPLGQWIRIDEEPFRVVGILKHYEKLYGRDNFLDRKNQSVFIPRSLARTLFVREPDIGEISIDAPSVEQVPLVAQLALNSVIQMHDGLHDVQTQSNLEFLEDWKTMQASFLAVGFAIGAVSLLVGGIGIMNLMMAAVNERVREIGLRMALGAWPRDLFIQFIAEAITLSGLGGLIGLGLAKAVIDFLAHNAAQGSPPLFNPNVAALGFGFSVLMGLLAGVYPAFRAARMDPVDALRSD